MHKKTLFMMIIISCLGLLISCQANTNQADTSALTFLVDLKPVDDTTIDIVLSLQAGINKLPADYQFNAEMVLTGPGEEKRAEVTINERPALGKGEIVRLVNWHGKFEPGHYTLKWGAPKDGAVITSFEVIENNNGSLNIDWQKLSNKIETPPAVQK
jgi:hypothetical protein